MTEEPTNDAGQALWQVCVEQLGQELPEQQFNTWIKPLTASWQKIFPRSPSMWPTASSWTGSVPSMRAASRPAGALYGQPVTLELALAQRESVVRTYVRPVRHQRAAPEAVAQPPPSASEEASARFSAPA
jgi:chromosomal replication initiator protein